MIATSKMGLASNFTCALSVRSRFSSSSIAGKNLFSSKKEILLLQKKISRSHSSSSEQIARASMAKVGEQISGVLQLGPWTDGMPTAVNMAERCKGKKVFLIGLPGTL
jgi:phage shock protein A